MRKTDHPLYVRWYGLIRRCEHPYVRDFPRYGGRGIRLCPRWHDFWAFVEDMGLPPSPQHTLDRIDNDGNYEPGNVRWATPTEQARNTSTSIHGAVVPFHPEVGQSDLARFYGVSRGTVQHRLERNGYRGSSLCGLVPGADAQEAHRVSQIQPIPPFAPSTSRSDLGEFYGVTKQAINHHLRTRGAVGSSLCGLTEGGGSVYGPRRTPARRG